MAINLRRMPNQVPVVTPRLSPWTSVDGSAGDRACSRVKRTCCSPGAHAIAYVYSVIRIQQTDLLKDIVKHLADMAKQQGKVIRVEEY
jgi:hypothetical protein